MVKFLKFRAAKTAAISEPKITKAGEADKAAPLSLNAAPSALLHDVLGPDAASDKSRQMIRKPASLPLSQKLSVGARLGAGKRQAIEAATMLASLVDEETARALGSLVADLESRVCRIAIAGQMNAGKSSLINVLVEQAELLPADINPWTTVITRLHFGVSGKPSSGASFQFFTLDEWRRLSAGGRTRELTERLFPDFDWDALQEQVQIMQQRAGKKLGPRFETLLGTEHIYEALTPGLLNRYVGAGQPEAVGGETSLEGEYSDITKAADVFFDLGAFNFPTILIDTPGVNDPFLVRDEVTRQSLQAADICVIVVTARQPLSTADLGLLRLLRGLDKNRLIIFLNKIDEIDASEEVLRAVSHRVSAILKEEFPSAHIPIVFGSAFWARQALSADLQSRAAFDGADKTGASGFDWPNPAEITADAFLAKSGLPCLAVAISELMQTGPVADAIDASKTVVEAVCRNLMECLETEIRLLPGAGFSASLARSEASAITALRDGLAARFDVLSQELAEIQSQKLAQLRAKLDETLLACLTETVPDLTASTLLAHLSQIDMRARVKLENAFLSAFDDAARGIEAALEKFNAEVKSLPDENGLIEKLTIALTGDSILSGPPSLAALGEPAALGLAASFGELAALRLPEERELDYLLQALVADFEPILAELAREASACLSGMAEDLVRQMRMLTLRPIETAIGRILKIVSEAETATDPGEVDLALAREIKYVRETIGRLRSILAAEVFDGPARGPG